MRVPAPRIRQQLLAVRRAWDMSGAVAGDPEMALREQRSRERIPITDGLGAELREVAERARVPFLVADADA